MVLILSVLGIATRKPLRDVAFRTMHVLGAEKITHVFCMSRSYSAGEGFGCIINFSYTGSARAYLH